ncbi:GNAT family N-acetyltransferase [candidate division KSB1 bacterium]|nr:GNAT family N-acetyltransferase [candidate division KSB1 bacterium]
MDINNEITFRLFSPADMPIILRWFDRGDFYYYSTTPKFVAENEIESFLIQRGNTFIIEAESKPIGLCDFHLLDARAKCCNIEVAFSYNDMSKDKKSQILKIFLSHIFQHIDVLKINKLVYGFDQNSLALCKDVGMKIEGAYEKHIYWEGEYHDLIYMAILKHKLSP